MHKVVISGLAAAYTFPEAEEAITDRALLEELHGLYSDASCAQSLREHPSLGRLDIGGGRLRFVFDQEKGNLRITTAYLVPEILGDDDTYKLVEFTRAQWSDSIGRGSFSNYRRTVLSTAMAMAILTAEPTRSNLGSYFVDAYPPGDRGVDILWFESDNEDEDLVSDLIRGAEAGHPLAQISLAARYEGGAGIKVDLGQAFRWIEQAAAKNVPFAAAKLGFYYLQGIGTAPDLVKAVDWLKKGVDLKVPMAMGILGDLYQGAVGVEKDLHKGFILYQRGSELGDVVCLNQVAECYREGRGVEKDLRKALKCYEECFEQGMEVQTQIENLRQGLKNS